MACAAAFAGLSVNGSNCGAVYTGFNFAAMRDGLIDSTMATLLLALEVTGHVLFTVTCFIFFFSITPCIYGQRRAVRRQAQQGPQYTESADFAQLDSYISAGAGSLEARQATTSTHDRTTTSSVPEGQASATSTAATHDNLLSRLRSGKVHPAASACAGSDIVSDNVIHAASMGAWVAPVGDDHVEVAELQPHPAAGKLSIGSTCSDPCASKDTPVARDLHCLYTSAQCQMEQTQEPERAVQLLLQQVHSCVHGAQRDVHAFFRVCVHVIHCPCRSRVLWACQCCMLLALTAGRVVGVSICPST
jgi:hypothetical protein